MSKKSQEEFKPNATECSYSRARAGKRVIVREKKIAQLKLLHMFMKRECEWMRRSAQCSGWILFVCDMWRNQLRYFNEIRNYCCQPLLNSVRVIWCKLECARIDPIQYMWYVFHDNCMPRNVSLFCHPKR